ncbi:MAG TPA: dihydrofolate reductase family protein, partial [Deinococcales bacterium]|nr:dihydrofolate reductase family protein [Deinococcales bacterium]
SFDTLGRLDWAGAEVGSDHLVSVVSEGADAAHLEKLERIGASFIVAGAEEIDLRKALESLHDDFGISTLLLEGGGHVNASFLQAGLVDEVSLLLAPVVDARRGIATVFDGLEGEGWAPTSLKLRSVEQRPGEILWLRYDVVRPD